MTTVQLEYTDFIHGIFEQVKGSGALGLPRCFEIRDTLKRAKDAFPKRHHKFLDSIVEHGCDLEMAVTALDTDGELPPGQNPARSKVVLQKRKQLEWFDKNASKTHKLITRPWSDLRTWTMNGILSVVMFALGVLSARFIA